MLRRFAAPRPTARRCISEGVNLIEKLIAGAIGTTAVLGLATWLPWNRLNTREEAHDAAMERKDALITAMVDNMKTALAQLRETVAENTQVTESLRDAIRTDLR